MNKYFKFLFCLMLIIIIAMPLVSLAQEEGSGLVTCSGADCDFGAFMRMINGIIDFIFTYLALPLAALMFAYAGFVLVTSGGSSEARGKAKNIFTDAIIGLMLAAGAWLIIKTILGIMGYSDGLGLFS